MNFNCYAVCRTSTGENVQYSFLSLDTMSIALLLSMIVELQGPLFCRRKAIVKTSCVVLKILAGLVNMYLLALNEK